MSFHQIPSTLHANERLVFDLFKLFKTYFELKYVHVCSDLLRYVKVLCFPVKISMVRYVKMFEVVRLHP